MRALSAASLDPARAAGTGREGGREGGRGGGREGGPPTHLLACMRPLKVPYGCVQQSALQHRGRDGGRRDGREAGLGQVGTIRVRPYINILGSLC